MPNRLIIFLLHRSHLGPLIFKAGLITLSFGCTHFLRVLQCLPQLRYRLITTIIKLIDAQDAE